jgi:hypothetical protein
MRRLIILVLLLHLVATIESLPKTKYLIPCKAKLIQASRDSAIAQVGVREKTGRNDGFKVEQYLKSVGRFKGDAYCAAGQYWCFYSSCLALKSPLTDIPIFRSSSTVTMFNEAIRVGYKMTPTPFDNDLIFWRKPNEWKGHVERIIEVMKAGWVKTVGFNTSSGTEGSQDDGGGVYFRKRNVNHFLGRMVLRGFIGFKPI